YIAPAGWAPPPYPGGPQPPLVPATDVTAPRLIGIARDVRVLRRHAFRGIQHHHRHLTALETLQRHHHRQLLERLRDFALATDASRIDEQVGLAAERHVSIHGIAGRAGKLVHEHALVPEHSVDERRLADVRPADDRDPRALR